MNSLFIPAIALMNRLGYTRKFTLLALLSVAAFGVVAYSLFACLNKEINVLQRELKGIRLISQVPKIVQPLQQHRGLSTGVLGGVETMRDKRAAKEKEVTEAFRKLDAELPVKLASGDDWRSIKANWERLQEKGLDQTQAECFAEHTSLIDQMLLFMVTIADEYALTLDPEIDSYYLIDTVVNKLPHVIEHLGQLRAIGLDNLLNRRSTERERMRINAVTHELSEVIETLDANFGKVARYNPALQDLLRAAHGDIADSVEQITLLVESDILTGLFTVQPEKYYAMTSVAIDASYQRLHESLLATTGTLLKARLTQAENTLRASVGVTLLLLLIVSYFAVGIYHSIIDGVRTLTRSARAVGGGDMSERVRLGTRDELSQIGDSFNEMVDGFNAMLEARKQAEEDMRESETKFRTLYESSSDGIMLLDENGFLDCNEAALRVFGCPTRDDFINKHPSLFSPPTQPGGQDSMSLAKKHIARAFTNGSDRFVWTHCRFDGAEFPAEVWLTSLNLNDKQLLQATVRDITARRNAEENLRKSHDELEVINRQLEEAHNHLLQSEKTLNDAQHLAHIGSWKRDLMTDSLTCSEEILRVLEIDPTHKNISYEAFISTVHSEDREMVDRAYLACIQTQKPFDIVHRLLLPGGRVKWVNERGTFYYHSNGVPLRSMGTIQDITERKQAEEKLLKYNEELVLANRQLEAAQNQLLQSEKMASIGQLAAGVAHEINNPIGYVYSNLGTLEKYVQDTFGMIDLYEQAEDAITDAGVRSKLKAAKDKLDIGFLKEDLRALMNESKDGITRVKQIVQNLKDFSHVDASDEWHFADLHRGIESTLNIVNNEIKYKANVVKEYGVIPEVECLSSQLNQVFMNLLVNASHAIEERGTITIRTGTASTDQQEEVWVEVADTGKGIAPEHLKKIFDPFFTTKPVGKGTGLGLSLSYGIIQEHHGRIEVHSEVGKGTTFRVYLPVKRPQAEEAKP